MGHIWNELQERVIVKMRSEKMPVRDRAEYICIENERITKKYHIQVYVHSSYPEGSNVADVEWRECPHKNLPEPSAAERLIIEELNRYKIQWYREVEFLAHKRT